MPSATIRQRSRRVAKRAVRCSAPSGTFCHALLPTLILSLKTNVTMTDSDRPVASASEILIRTWRCTNQTIVISARQHTVCAKYVRDLGIYIVAPFKVRVDMLIIRQIHSLRVPRQELLSLVCHWFYRGWTTATPR